MENWLGILLGLMIITPFFAAIIIWSCCTDLNLISDVISRTFRGEKTDDLSIAFRSGIAPEDLCLPLTTDTLRRVHACTQVTRAKADTALRSKLLLLVGVADLDVTYDFEGTEPDGQTLTIQQQARVRIHHEKPRYSATLIITRVEPIYGND